MELCAIGPEFDTSMETFPPDEVAPDGAIFLADDRPVEDLADQLDSVYAACLLVRQGKAYQWPR